MKGNKKKGQIYDYNKTECVLNKIEFVQNMSIFN